MYDSDTKRIWTECVPSATLLQVFKKYAKKKRIVASWLTDDIRVARGKVVFLRNSLFERNYENERIITELAEKSYKPAMQTMLDMIAENGKAFKVAFSISGVSLELIEQYAPEVLELLGQLVATGCVEFLAEPYSHGLSSLGNTENFVSETKRQAKKIKQMFGQSPKYKQIVFIFSFTI